MQIKYFTFKINYKEKIDLVFCVMQKLNWHKKTVILLKKGGVNLYYTYGLTSQSLFILTARVIAQIHILLYI